MRIRIVDFAIVFLAFFSVSIFYLGVLSYRLNRQPMIVTSQITPTPTKQSSGMQVSIKEGLVSALSPTPTQTSEIKTNDQIPWGETFKINEEISATYFAADDHMATSDELNQAMNIYRQSHSLPTLTFDSLLCQIAEKRASQLVEKGELSHDGFSELAKEQNSFGTMAEVIFGGNQPVSGVHIIEWGWDKSLTGHHEAISDPKWNEGCGATKEFYAVFIFGKR